MEKGAAVNSRLVSLKRAREIMGNNYFGVKEAHKHLAVNPTERELSVLDGIPFSEASLQACRHTHVLCAVFSLSILDIRSRLERGLFYRHENAWYNKHLFARNCGKPEWHLVNKYGVPYSKNWREQLFLLSAYEQVPSARVMAYAIIGHYLATGERLFESVCVRTADTIYPSGYRVGIGRFDRCGLDIDCWGSDLRRSFIGLASEIKPA